MYNLSIPDGASRLEDCCHPGSAGFIDYVAKRKESVRSQYRTSRGGLRLLNTEFDRVDTAHLPGSHADRGPPSARTIALDFTCLATRHAKCRSRCSFSVGRRFVTILDSGPSKTLSTS